MRVKRVFMTLIPVGIGLFIFFSWHLRPVLSSTIIIVDGSGDAIAEDGLCMLREAVINANQDSQAGSTDCAPGSGADTIRFALAGGSVISITDQSGVPDSIIITDTLTIGGSGVNQLAIAQDSSHTRRLFDIEAGVAFTITDITLRDFYALSTGQDGAVIHNDGGILTVQRVHFINNRTQNAGGAIISENGGFLTVEESVFRHNAVLSSNGGALNIDSDAVVRHTLFYSNTASNTGGAIKVGASITVSIENSVFAHNLTRNDGGAMHISSNAVVTIAHSTFQDNVCDGCEGGAIANFGFLTLLNSTLSGNTARTGGGIYDNSGSTADYATTLLHTTIVNNTSDPDGGGGLYIRRGSSGAMLNFQMGASIVADNHGGNDCDFLPWPGVISSNGDNMVESGCEDFFSQPTDLPGVDPMLAPLQDNGGVPAPIVPPFTHALLADSQAVDLGECDGKAVTLDQRYAARPVEAGCDAGAYEFGGMPPPPPPPDVVIFLPFMRR